jgi:outer membrane protein W
MNKEYDMLSKLIAGIVLGILILLPISARSQVGVYVGPHLGVMKTDGADATNYLVGGTLRIKLMPAIGVEGNIGYRQEKFGNGAVTVKTWPVTVTGLLYPIPMIYGGLGGGWYSTTFDYADNFNQAGFADETVREFGYHLVAGVEIPASPAVHVFGDVRFVFLDYDFKDLPGAVLDGAKSNFYSINVGLLFRL